MTKRLISFLIALCLLIAIPLSARYKYNPFTRKLDYYETGADIDLGDLADVTLTGLATGNVLYYSGTAWVNLATGANTQFLTLAAGIPAWQAIPAGVTTFVGLTDTPNAYTGKAGQLVRVNAAPDGLEFFAGSAAGTVIVADGSGGWTKDENFLITSGSASGTGSLTANSGGASGEIGLNLYGAGAGPQFSSIVQSDAEGAGSELRIGVDETTRTVQIVDRGDLGVNFPWGGVSSNPTLYFVNADADKASLITNFDGNLIISNYGANGLITMQAGLYIDFVKETDSAGDDSHAFFFGTWDGDGELIDTDAEQSWMKIAPQINQTSTAHYVGLLMDVTEISTGSGTNELMALRVGGTDVFTVGHTGSLDLTLSEVTDRILFYMSNAVGTENQPLISVVDDREGATVDEKGEATLALRTETAISWALWVSPGQAQFDGNTIQTEDVFWTWADASDRAIITQSAVAGIANTPLIFIDDDRTGATANVKEEATIRIDAEGLYSFYFEDGWQYFGDRSVWGPDVPLYIGGDIDQFVAMWDANGAGDGLMLMGGGDATNDSSALMFIKAVTVDGMTDHDNYRSTTFVVVNRLGADGGDYSAVVMGERAQANVAVAHYFDFYAMTGALDGAVDGTTTELAPTFRFGDAGSAVPDNATGPGDVLFEDDIEVDGVSYFDGGMGADLLPSADGGSDLGDNTYAWQDIVQTATGAHYYGDTDVDTTWKTVRDGTKLSFLRRESGSYVEKGYFDESSFHSANIYVGNVRLEEEHGCLATNEFHAHGVPPVAGYFKFYQGTTPAVHKEAGHSILWVDANDVLYLEKPDGTDVAVGSSVADMITITGANATIKLVDDSGNFAIIKAGNSQLTLAADPDNAVVSTDIVFDMDGGEVARFQQGGQFRSLDSIIAKEGFATQLWNVAGANFEVATTGTEYYSPNQQGGIYGVIYRQYFLTSLPSGLTSGNNVSELIDYTIIVDNGSNRHTMCGWSSDGTNEVNIGLLGTSGNGNLYLTTAGNFDGNVQKGWVDYTK